PKVAKNICAVESTPLTNIILLSEDPDKRLKVYSPAASFLSPTLKSKGIFALIGILSCAFADATAAQRVNIEIRLNIVSLLITFLFIHLLSVFGERRPIDCPKLRPPTLTFSRAKLVLSSQ